MSKDFKPLFEYLDNMKTELKQEIVEDINSNLGQKIDNLQRSVDSFAKSNQKFDQEVTIQSHRVSNIESWIKSVAKKIKLPYKA